MSKKYISNIACHNTIQTRAVYWQESGDMIMIMIQGLRFNILFFNYNFALVDFSDETCHLTTTCSTSRPHLCI